MRDISANPLDPPVLATPAPEFIHAVHVADEHIMCSYEPKPDDKPDPARDWTTVQPGEDCAQAVKLVG